MKKSFFISICILLAFGLLHSLSAKSNEKELDQAELMKQFIGTWDSEVGGDTVISLRISPHNNGMYIVQENKANGNTFFTLKQVIGFSDDKKMFIATFTAADGTAIIDLGKFVTKNKYVSDRYLGNICHANGQGVWEFTTPESFSVRFRWRGNKMIWLDDWTTWTTFKKIK